MMSVFLNGFGAGLPANLTFDAFSRVVQSTCLNSSQLRMMITGTEIVKTGQNLVVSQVSTVILSYLTRMEQL